MSATIPKEPAHENDRITDSELPEGWASATINAVTETAPNMKPEASPDRVFGYVDISSICNQTYQIDNIRHFKGKDAPSRARRPIKPGDVLFSNVRTYLRNIALVPGSLEAQLCSTGFTVLRSNGVVVPDLLFHQVLTDRFINLVTAQQTGSQYPATSDRIVTSTEIPVPPQPEQIRIVAKIEELLVQVNAVRARLDKVAQLLKRFRQSVLAAACSGRLTEGWRANGFSPEDVDAIVNTIRSRRFSVAKSTAQTEKIKGIYEYSEANDSSGLPETWRFVALNKLCSSFDYGTSAKSTSLGLVPVLRMGNIQNGKIDWSDLVYTSNTDEVKKYSLVRDTVLFNRTNSPELVGKTAIYRGERPAIFAGYLIRVVTQPELDPRYLNVCMNTNYAREFCSRVKTDGVSQSNINAQKLGTFEVPYCPLAEQHEIVRRIEVLFKLTDEIEKRVNIATKRAGKLTQAILAKAFRGELVPTEAELARREGREYETAAELLARIKTERERPSRTSDRANMLHKRP